MMRLACAGLLLLALAGCGANGEPEPVEGGFRIGGTASIGLSGRL